MLVYVFLLELCVVCDLLAVTCFFPAFCEHFLSKNWVLSVPWLLLVTAPYKSVVLLNSLLCRFLFFLINCTNSVSSAFLEMQWCQHAYLILALRPHALRWFSPNNCLQHEKVGHRSHTIFSYENRRPSYEQESNANFDLATFQKNANTTITLN